MKITKYKNVVRYIVKVYDKDHPEIFSQPVYQRVGMCLDIFVEETGYQTENVSVLSSRVWSNELTLELLVFTD